MRPAGTLLQLAVCLTSLTPLTAAWPGWLPHMDSVVVLRRADSTDTATDASETGTATGKASITTRNLNTATIETDTATETNTDETETGTATKKSKTTSTRKKGKTTAAETHTSYNVLDPAGGVTMQTPVTTAQPTPLYKIGDYITFGWNYTSLQGTPSAVDVLVSCSTASETWTLTTNMTFTTKAEFVWDTEAEATNVESPLLVQLYTLIIKDSDTSITDSADSGYLAVYSGLQFGLYTGRPYTPLSDWECVGCNAAPPSIDRHAVGFAVTVSVITIVSFTWFVTGLGLH
ncbi:hypothetical protein B0J13DRAFT_610549 [Dactylonectria estremocensis]|uniref:DUF7137 domain-containing protein n=1 Tax=Dactylonectria estremocensis TaxID=1079267 RepID=A0A9P9IS83_9HYPO|nr:hypothetical protein B0J13DRAFT_610549 [Dactylonectria estremocensis]